MPAVHHGRPEIPGPGRVLKPQAPAYVTVEVYDGPLAAPGDPGQVPGEHFEGGNGGYHYYPAQDQVRNWLTAAGFRIDDE